MPFWKTFKAPRSRVIEETTKKNGNHHAIISVKGNIYRGGWKNDQKHGQGVFLRKSDFKLYEGEWLSGKKSGYGVMSKILDNGTRALDVEGAWLKGKPEGAVRKHYINGVNGDSEAYYDGMMKAGNREGHGRMWYADGSFYEGHWRADQRDGIGLFVEVNGNRYEGEWRANKKHGYGQFFHLHTGQMQYGLWKRGIPVLSVMKDIQFRQACEQPTPYPIPAIGLLDSDKVYEEEFHRITKELATEPNSKEDIVTKTTIPKRNLSPWFYVDCCNKVFSKNDDGLSFQKREFRWK